MGKSKDDEHEDATLNLTVYPDEQPRGDWVDVEDLIAHPTDEEIAEGKRLGEEIDPDDDEDCGVV